MDDERQGKIELFSQKMRATGYSSRTISTYSAFVRSVMDSFGTSRLLRVSSDKIYAYSSELKSDSSRHQLLNALKCYFRLMENNTTKINKIERPKKKESIPMVYSIAQVQRVIKSVKNIKHRTILSVLYGTGIRREELINIELSHINRSREALRVVEGKGNKTRETVCSKTLIAQLDTYWKVCRPKKYLFEGVGGERYSAESVYNVVKRAFANHGLKASPHTLRHCFTTHLLEADVSTRKIQKMLGHKRITTLEVYSKLVKIGSLSPLDLISY